MNQVHYEPGIVTGAQYAQIQLYYTPPLTRFLVCALYHQAKQLGIPMTQLANDLVEAGLRESAGWKEAQAQQQAQEAMRVGEGVREYRTK